MATECNISAVLFQKTVSVNRILFLTLDFVIAIMTILGNSTFMLTLIKNRALHTPSNMLLGALCFSDLLIGYVVHPMYFGFYFKVELQRQYDALLHKIVRISSDICVGLSFMFAVLVSLDRYAAICHPYRYHVLASCKTHLWITIVSGMTWMIIPVIHQFIDEPLFLTAYEFVCVATGVMLIIFSYCRIYSVIKMQRRSVQTLGTIETASGTNQRQGVERSKHERARTNMILVILVCQFVCFAPYFALMIYFLAISRTCLDSTIPFILNIWVVFIVLVNSAINPIIYCAKCNEIKTSIFRFLCGNRHDESHSTDDRRN